MTIRTTTQTVTIAQPFSLRGCVQTLEAGVYLIETDETVLEGLSFCAYQRTKTFIHLDDRLGRPGTARILSVSGDDLDTAIGIGRTILDLKSSDRWTGDEGMTRSV